MDLNESVEAFFASIKDWGDAIEHPSFCYVALETATGFELLQARLIFGATTPFAPLGSFSFKRVMAGHFRLSEIDISPEDFLAGALSGVVRTPQGNIQFSSSSGRYGGYYQPFHTDGMPNRRIGVLTILGGKAELQQLQPELDWELKGATVPYDGLQELMNHYRVGTLRSDVIAIEAVALEIIAVDLSTLVTGTECEIAVRMSPACDPAKAGITYRVMGGNVVKRDVVSGESMKWEVGTDGMRRGSTKIQVPRAAVVQAYASYSGIVYHQGWIADPSMAQNPRRASYEAFDRELASIADFLAKQPGKGNARDLESGVAWLLWMLGFSVTNLGQTPKLQEAPDLIATTPQGHFAVIECTTGPLKTDNKLPLLIERSEIVRSRLEASNNQHLKVLPVIVTSKKRSEIRGDIEQAERLGVLIITAETLAAALPRTLERGDADVIFLEGEREVATALAKYEAQRITPLDFQGA
ncbi:hypothetical protein GOZ97_16055 [Agrobacterium vitis]|uniref:hypothetical protein n=1 Tax=Rhizobium/Agrobacterium group TaxID=227290 RepID=UPI0008FB2DB2|nr:MULTISPECIES: hypothetical protein [Rhizobium/Agrobacterium group]MCF1433675.1 hypothetical protein [Allorhizobium ampelinum]MUO91764.1 hypothetical protein [Agrobacterium vitis]MUZ53931.1 hypothetical protein [Agrobacterium vitis]MUZ92943.1 hypothetical protein [Agrobacterium vitis]MVA40755.1 hypothetical protein [Agrobacterium vitis]